MIRLRDEMLRCAQHDMSMMVFSRQDMWEDFLMACAMLLVHPHQIQHAVDVAPVEDAAMDDGPAAFVVAADDFDEVAAKVVPEVAEVDGAQVDVIPPMVGVAAHAGADVER